MKKVNSFSVVAAKNHGRKTLILEPAYRQADTNNL
jgi:hypothetical protein